MNTRHLISLAALAALGASTALADEALPRRKAGMWETQMMMDAKAAPGAGAMKTLQCIDAKTDEEMQRKAMAGNDRKANCKQTSMKRISGGYEMDAECTGEDGITKVHARMTGDMNSAYTVENKMTFVPPRHGMSEANMTMKASYKGACPADMKPGDVRVQGMPFNPGANIDVNKLKNMSPEERQRWMEQMQKGMQGGKQ
ncbi:MAG: DUF3617 family protein [Burkholderiales bacterium]|nr:DUF3617 family protein [Burkholderiales bacterium]